MQTIVLELQCSGNFLEVFLFAFRVADPEHEYIMTEYVATRWYRAPGKQGRKSHQLNFTPQNTELAVGVRI